MNKLMSLSQGKKTYAIVALSVVLGIIHGLHEWHYIPFDVPDWAMWLMPMFGLGAIRAGVKDQAAATTENILALVSQVMSQVQVPDTPPQPTPVGSDESKVTADLNKVQASK